jgi:MFS family permease
LAAAHHTGKVISGICMFVAPLLLLVSALVQPELETGEAPQLAVIAEHPDRWFIAGAFALAALAAAVPAVLGLMHMLRERRTILGHLGGGLALVGILAFTGAVAINLVAWQMAQPGTDRTPMVALLDNVHDTTGIWIPFYLFTFAFPAGLTLLAAGLVAARALTPVIGVLIAVGGVLVAIGYPVASELLVIAGAACLTLGVGSTGFLVLRESDADWDHTPPFRGFRPAAGAQ